MKTNQYPFNYSELLRDPRWQKMRLKILSRDKWRCRQCKRGDVTLSVHHLFYGDKPWEIDKKWLVTVCDKCHKILEAKKYQPLELTDAEINRMYKRHNKASKYDRGKGK